MYQMLRNFVRPGKKSHRVGTQCFVYFSASLMAWLGECECGFETARKTAESNAGLRSSGARAHFFLALDAVMRAEVVPWSLVIRPLSVVQSWL
jgi:hypothetical protein